MVICESKVKESERIVLVKDEEIANLKRVNEQLEGQLRNAREHIDRLTSQNQQQQSSLNQLQATMKER